MFYRSPVGKRKNKSKVQRKLVKNSLIFPAMMPLIYTGYELNKSFYILSRKCIGYIALKQAMLV